MKYTPQHLLAHTTSPLGPITLASSPIGLCGLWFDGQKHMPNLQACSQGHSPFNDQAAGQIAQYFAGQRMQFDVLLDLSLGTPFQQAVWQALQTIGSGAHRSYGAVAQQIGKAAAVRAVGAAVGRNPISIIVPCHRVLGASGALTGYAGGLERKTALLRLEHALPGHFTQAALI